MKRILSFCLAVLLLISMMPMTAMAAEMEDQYVNAGNMDKNYGILTTEDGKQYLIEGTIVEENSRSNRNGEQTITYKYDIPSAPATRLSSDASGDDGGYVSTVYVTVHYASRNVPVEYLLTKVTGRWEIRDSRVSVESAELSYGCNGFFPETVTTQSVFGVPVGNNFSVSTGFKKYVCIDVGAVIGSNLTVNYLMGTSRRWSFTLQNTLVNS